MKVFTLSLIGLALVTSGCATVFKGRYESVSLKTDQPKALVYIDGNYVGITPLDFPLDAKKPHTIEFRKMGYVSKQFILNNKISATYRFLDSFTLIPLIVDAATGDWSTLESNEIKLALEPQRFAPVAKRAR